MTTPIDLSEFEGKSEAEIKEYVHKNQIPFRISNRDGIPFMLTRDYIPQRWNLQIVKGIVIKITQG